jgi:adenylate cyclase, class 2
MGFSNSTRIEANHNRSYIKVRIEVEQKFPVADMVALREQLTGLGAAFAEAELQVDTYFAHPSRDFSLTDEATRLRQVGVDNCLTYKGPKLDATTKTRREIEVPLAKGEPTADSATELLEALGFTKVAVVRKHRIHSTLPWRQWAIEIALDEIAQIGSFIELEIVANDENLGPAREAIGGLASHLGLANAERRSYLELLLAKRAGT